MSSELFVCTPSSHEAIDLLKAANLPVDDIELHKNLWLRGLSDGSGIVGLVGLEWAGDTALLRSLVVADSARGTGLGKKLTHMAEAEALSRGISRLFLLTTTASGFFSRLGYELADRETAPPPITQTSQFKELCPASATFMMKKF